MKTRISTLVVISLLILAVFSFYQIHPAKATVQTTYLPVNQFTADDNKWIKVGSSPYLSSIDYPTNYILSRSDRPSESAVFTIQSPVNMTGQYGDMPQGRIDYYAESLNGSNEVFTYTTRTGAYTSNIGSTWAWNNKTFYAPSGFYNIPTIPSGANATNGFSINSTIRGTKVTITSTVRLAYVYTVLGCQATGNLTTKMAIYDTSYNYISTSTEYTETPTITQIAINYNFPTCPYLVAGTYWFTWWANSTAFDTVISNYTEDQFVNFNFYQSQTYDGWPATLSPTFANGTLTGNGGNTIILYVVPSTETISVYFEKRYVGEVAIDKVVATIWNSTTTYTQTCSGFTDADPSLLKIGDAPYLDISDYPTNYISYPAASYYSSLTDYDCFYTFTPTSLNGITDVKLDFNGSGTIRYYLLSSDMSINYTNTIVQSTSSWASADIFAYVPNATFINKLRIALRPSTSGYTDAMRLEVTGDYESLSLLIQDSSGNPISGAVAEFVDGGDTNVTSSSTGWANLTGILLNTNVTVKVAYQNAWVNGTFTVNMTADKNVNVTCKVYSLTVYLQTSSDSPVPNNSITGATLTLSRNDLANLTSYGLTPQVTSAYNLTHAAYTWNQLANQTYQITANIVSAGGPKSSIVDLQASNSTLIQLVYPVGSVGPGPGPGPITPQTPGEIIQKIIAPIVAPAVTLASMLNDNKWPIILIVGVCIIFVVPFVAIQEKKDKKKKNPFRKQE